MRDRLRALAAVVLTAATAVSACSAPAVSGSATTGGPPANARASTLPPRPEEIDLTGVDTCTLLTPQQQQQLGLDVPPGLSRPDRYGNPRCNFGRVQYSPRYGYQIVAVTQEDVSVYLDGSRYVTARPVSVGGFPAVESRRPTDERGCFVDVSTMAGQYLSVRYGESAGIDESAAVACEKARLAAEMALQTLLAQR